MRRRRLTDAEASAVLSACAVSHFFHTERLNWLPYCLERFFKAIEFNVNTGNERYIDPGFDALALALADVRVAFPPVVL